MILFLQTVQRKYCYFAIHEWSRFLEICEPIFRNFTIKQYEIMPTGSNFYKTCIQVVLSHPIEVAIHRGFLMSCEPHSLFHWTIPFKHVWPEFRFNIRECANFDICECWTQYASQIALVFVPWYVVLPRTSQGPKLPNHSWQIFYEQKRNNKAVYANKRN